MSRLTPTEMGAWRGFLETRDQLWNTLEEAMQKRCGLNLTAYELLLAVEEAGEPGLRMSDLAARLRYTSGGLTRLADKLQQQGLIERERSQADGRGFQIHLTARGRQQLRRIHVEHLRDVRSLFLSRLNDQEQQQLVAIWEKLSGDIP